jgi:hypothetical protein
MSKTGPRVRHHLLGRIVGGLHAGDRGVEVRDQSGSLLLLGEDLAEDRGLTLQFGIEGLALAGIELDDGGVGHQGLEVVVELGEPLAVHDQVGLDRHHGLQVGLAVRAEIGDGGVGLVAEVGGDQGHRRGGQLDPPLLQGLEEPVVGGHHAGRRHRHGLCAVVVLDGDGGGHCGRGLGRGGLSRRALAGAGAERDHSAQQQGGTSGATSDSGHGNSPGSVK